jgi:hypothetical protein
MHRLADSELPFALPAAALAWPLLGIALFDTDSAEQAMALLLAPSLLLVGGAAVLFYRAIKGEPRDARRAKP